MHEITIPASQIIATHNAIAALQSWLRPGLLSFIVGEHVDATRSQAIRVFTERDHLLEEYSMKYPGVYPDDEANEALRGKPHPMAGRRVLTVNSAGQEITVFKSPEASKEFNEREAALYGVPITLRVSMRLTLELIRTLDKERLDAPRPLNGMAPSDNVVDFAALLPLIDRDYTPDGVASSVIPLPLSRKEN